MAYTPDRSVHVFTGDASPWREAHVDTEATTDATLYLSETRGVRSPYDSPQGAPVYVEAERLRVSIMHNGHILRWWVALIGHRLRADGSVGASVEPCVTTWNVERGYALTPVLVDALLYALERHVDAYGTHPDITALRDSLRGRTDG